MLLTITILLLISLYIAIKWYRSKSFQEYRKTTPNKFTIPAVYWEDYSRVNMAIYLMDYGNADKVWHQIEVFCDKYSQFIDYKAYIDSTETLIANYKRRQEFL
jgi:hypothetical protein